MQQPSKSGRAIDGSAPQSRAAARRTRALPLRPQDEVECRRCHVRCDKVVYPAACLERGCPFVYAYEDHGHTFMGCMQKVYTVEIDIDLPTFMLRIALMVAGAFAAALALWRLVPQP